MVSFWMNFLDSGQLNHWMMSVTMIVLMKRCEILSAIVSKTVSTSQYMPVTSPSTPFYFTPSNSVVGISPPITKSLPTSSVPTAGLVSLLIFSMIHGLTTILSVGCQCRLLVPEQRTLLHLPAFDTSSVPLHIKTRHRCKSRLRICNSLRPLGARQLFDKYWEHF